MPKRILVSNFGACFKGMLLRSIEIAERYNGEIVGNADEEITHLCAIEQGNKGGLTFLANPKYLPYLYQTEASAVIISKDFIPERKILATLIKVENPYAVFTDILVRYADKRINRKGIEPGAIIAETAQVSPEAYIGANAYIGENVVIHDGVQIYPNVYIGANTTIAQNTVVYPNVTIYDYCKIGANCILHAGAVIGADGFGFAPQSNGEYVKIPQVGNVILEDFVEIGANTCIDRATLGSTIIKKGVKIDNLVQIAHNCVIDSHTVIAAQTGISGSTKIGKYCMIGGQVGIVGHIQIADKTQIGAQSGISKTIKNVGEQLRGSPAQNLKNQLKSEALFQMLPELFQRIKELEQQLQAIQNQNHKDS